MRKDYLIALTLAVASIPLGVALMAAPEYLHLSRSWLAFTFWAGIGLTVTMMVVAAAVALKTEAVAYFWSAQQQEKSSVADSSRRPTFEAITGGHISARGAQIPGNLPFQVGRAETGGRIIMDGFTIVREGEGGKGGGGEIFGNNGLIIGGKGGRVGDGSTGRGGDGGSGILHGDGGMIIGGEGGSVDGSHVWYPPAQSGYIHYLESQGLTPDFGLQYPGAGGASGGWLERQQVVLKIREDYFRRTGQTVKISTSKIDDVPLQYINEKLEEAGYSWRARIDKKYWYLYYVP